MCRSCRRWRRRIRARSPLRPRRGTRILGEAGFSDVALEAHALSLDIALGNGLDAAVRSAFEIGPASRALEGHPPETREAAQQSVRDLLAQHLTGGSVPLAGSIWLVTARV